jgi:CRISPR/Cas system CMR subunit Cmr4 (Cas7 group RAMP superfamily)
LVRAGALYSVTTQYNIARLHEDLRNTSEAENIYKQIVADHPHYIDGTYASSPAASLS